jgi:hypothetical protein
VFGSDPNAPLPDLVDKDIWQYQLSRASDQLQFRIWSMVDVGAVLRTWNEAEIPYKIPQLQSYLSGTDSIIAINQWLNTDRNETAFEPIIDTLPGVYSYDYNHYHITSLSVSKYVPLHGPPQIKYTIANRDVIALADWQVRGSLADFNAAFPYMEREVAEWLAEDPVGHQIFYIVYSLRIADMHALVSTEVNMYGPLPFISDLGGFLSMLMLGVGILFPIVAKVTEVSARHPCTTVGETINIVPTSDGDKFVVCVLCCPLQPRKFLPFILLNQFGHSKPATAAPSQKTEPVMPSSPSGHSGESSSRPEDVNPETIDIAMTTLNRPLTQLSIDSESDSTQL